jgi:hypothetical protein
MAPLNSARQVRSRRHRHRASGLGCGRAPRRLRPSDEAIRSENPSCRSARSILSWANGEIGRPRRRARIVRGSAGASTLTLRMR